METVWITKAVTAAIGPMLYATFSNNTAAKSAVNLGFVFVWPIMVLFSLPLAFSPGQVAPELFVVTAVVLPAMAVCASVLVARRRRK